MLFGWERGHQLSMYATDGGRGVGVGWGEGNISNSHCKKPSKTIKNRKASVASSISTIYLLTLFTHLLLLYSNFHKKQAFKCLFKIHLWRETDNVTFYFLIYLVKIWRENGISIAIRPRIIYFWIWLFGGTANQGGEEALGKGDGGTDEKPLPDKPLLILCC